MKKLTLSGALVAVGLALSGCSETDVQEGAKRWCGYYPTAKLVVGVLRDITGQPPGVGVGITAAQSAIEAICAAYNKSKTPGSRGLALVSSRNMYTGAVTLRTLDGRLVAKR